MLRIMKNDFINDEQILAFVKVYKQPRASLLIAEGVDLHQEFANMLGIERQSAKELCHQINYSFDMMVM